MKSVAKNWKRRVLWVGVACLCLTSVAAARHLASLKLYIPLPGIDRYGLPDLTHYSNVPFKVVIDTRNGKVLARGTGRVRNLSGRHVHFRNLATTNPGIIGIPNVVLTSDHYAVHRKGYCLALAKGYYVF